MSIVTNLPRNLLVLLINETIGDTSPEATTSLNNIFKELVKRNIHPDIINSLRQTGRINADLLPETPIDELELLSNFMLRNKKLGDPTWNYAINGSIRVAPNILDDQMDNFFNIYSDAIYAGKRINVMERHGEIGPIALDLDFRYLKKLVDDKHCRCYTTSTITKCITLYNEIIEKYLDVTDKNMTAYVMEKKSPTIRTNVYADGIHIMYPEICVRNSTQLSMRKDFIRKLSEEKVFAGMLLVTDVLTENHIDNWLLYGSSGVGCEPYELTGVYEKLNSSNGPGIYNVINLRFIGKRIDGKFTKSTINHLVRYLSIRKFKDESWLTPLSTTKDILSEEKLTAVIVDIKKDILLSDENLITARKLIKLLSPERAIDNQKWYEIGHILNNIDIRLLEDWIEFSKHNSSKFSEIDCIDAWKRMKPSVYTMRSLHYFAYVDTPAYKLEIQKQARENFPEYFEKKDESDVIPKTIDLVDTSDMPPLMSVNKTVAYKKINADKENELNKSVGASSGQMSSIASPDINEPITASSLKSFHKKGSGGSVSNGLPQVKELLSIPKKTDNNSVPIVPQPKEKQSINLKEIVAEMKALNITKIQIKKDSVKVEYKLNPK